MALEKASGAPAPRIVKATTAKTKPFAATSKAVASKPVIPVVAPAPAVIAKAVAVKPAVKKAKPLSQPAEVVASAPMASAIKEASAEMAKMAEAAPAPADVKSVVAAATEVKASTEKLAPTVQDTAETALVEAPKVAAETAKTLATAIPAIPAMGALPHFSGYDDLAAFGKANFTAFVEANSLLCKGVEAISKEIFDHSVSSFESAAAATRALLSAKTFKDVVELNTTFTKAGYDRLMAVTTKIGEMTAKVAAESARPIKARATEVIETVSHPAA